MCHWKTFWKTSESRIWAKCKATDLEMVLFGHEFVVPVGAVVADQFIPVLLEGLSVREAVDALPNTVDNL